MNEPVFFLNMKNRFIDNPLVIKTEETCALSQASATMQVRSVLFWGIMPRGVAFPYQHYRTSPIFKDHKNWRFLWFLYTYRWDQQAVPKLR